MIQKNSRRFNLKSNTKQRYYIDIVRTNKCYITPFLSVQNIMRKGNTYISVGWLFWRFDYFRENIISSECDESKI